MNFDTGRVAIAMLLAMTIACFLMFTSRTEPPDDVTPQVNTNGDISPPNKPDDPYGIEKRLPWTTSRIVGTPEPPPPYRTVRVYPKLHFDRPTVITSAPGTDRLFVAQQDGKLFSFPNDETCETPDLLIDLAEQFENLTPNSNAQGVAAIYGVAFHPKFETNRYCYICYTLKNNRSGKDLLDGTRVSRFLVSAGDPPRCDPKSEQVVITWLLGGHNGGCLKFGPDGYLYVSTGDGGNAFPPDGRSSGQDTSNLLSAILRIDVDRSHDALAYAIPADNPLVDLEGSRGEIWAYGVRNPWKMTFDRKTGDLWVGDVGWELWELVYRIERGGNYGWSIKEGRQPVHMERKRGPTPILPPTVEIPHTDGASITGGFVYRGKRLPGLVGTYIFGDWETRRIWGVPVNEKGVGKRKDLVEPRVRLVAFAEDNQGELYLLDYDVGTIHQLEANNQGAAASEDFPRKLSETGLFSSVENHQPAAGVIPFSVNVEQWSDHAIAERFVALPGNSSVIHHDKSAKIEGSMFSRSLEFPKGSVLAKTMSLEMERGNPQSRRHLETQILHFDGLHWRGYSYVWNEEQTDATLVDAAGTDRTFTVLDPNTPSGRLQQTWHIPARAQCTRCHNPWAEHTLAFNIRQLDKAHDYGDVTDNQLRTLAHVGVLTSAETLDHSEKKSFDSNTIASSDPAFTNPYDESTDLNKRARSYLHVNCAHCHRFNGGGVSYIILEYGKSLDEMKVLGSRPTQGTFGIHDAKIVAAGDPFGSILYYRISTIGRGRMPHVGSNVVDENGRRLIYDWIRQLPPRNDELVLIEKLQALDEPVSLAREAEEKKRAIARIAKQIAKKDERDETNNDDVEKATKRHARQLLQNAKSRVQKRSTLIEQLITSTSNSLILARSLKRDDYSTGLVEQVTMIVAKQGTPPVRELFEQFLPSEKRAKRLGTTVKPDDILALLGDRERGKELFFKTEGVACRNCHRINKLGKQLGPDLDKIGKKYDRRQLLESILEPSKKIDPKFTTYLIETITGRVFTGLVSERTDKRVVLRDAQNKEAVIMAEEIEEILPQRRSLMPELLVRDLTANQLADLLAFLASLK